ncbi:MAG: hypothetical protein ACYSW8_30815 [Planctomycetota bacterium]|jgi:hypothetical protein
MENIAKDIESCLADLIDDFDAETDREEVIEALDGACDSLWGNLVQQGLITDYTVGDMVATATECAAIIKYAEDHAWVEDDSGLWEGVTYGVLAIVAYYSLRNCLYQALADMGHDTNDEFPFEKGEA